MAENIKTVSEQLPEDVNVTAEPEVAEEAVVEEAPVSPENGEPGKGAKFAASLKEWCRKRIVNLKRNVSIIPFIVLIVSTVVYLIELTNFSQSVMISIINLQEWCGLCVFVNCLLSLLVLVSYMRIFPKRKKNISIPMLVVTLVFIALMILLDVVYYNEANGLLNDIIAQGGAKAGYDTAALNTSIAHIVMLGITVVLLATMPLYKKLILKINTSKVVESAAGNMGGSLDLEETE